MQSGSKVKGKRRISSNQVKVSDLIQKSVSSKEVVSKAGAPSPFQFTTLESYAEEEKKREKGSKEDEFQSVNITTGKIEQTTEDSYKVNGGQNFVDHITEEDAAKKRPSTPTKHNNDF